MGTSFSKRGLVEFDENPEEFQEFHGGERTRWGRWSVSFHQLMDESTGKEYTIVCIEAEYRLEFAYQIMITHNSGLEEPIVMKGMGDVVDSPHFCYYDPNTYSSDYRVNCQIFAYAVIDECKIRNFAYYMWGDHWKMEELWDYIYKMTHIRAPLLLNEAFDDARVVETLGLMVFGVRKLLYAKELPSYLKLASKCKLIDMKRYCENQLIWRDDFKFSQRRLYKLAGKYQLDKLLKDLLVDVKSAKELLEIVNSTMKIDKLNGEMSKSIVGKIFELV